MKHRTSNSTKHSTNTATETRGNMKENVVATSEEVVNIKISFKETCRRFQLVKENILECPSNMSEKQLQTLKDQDAHAAKNKFSLLAILDKLNTFYGPKTSKNLEICYKDDEGDIITVGTDLELETAYNVSKRMNNKDPVLVRLILNEKKRQKKEKAVTNAKEEAHPTQANAEQVPSDESTSSDDSSCHEDQEKKSKKNPHKSKHCEKKQMNKSGKRAFKKKKKVSTSDEEKENNQNTLERKNQTKCLEKMQDKKTIKEDEKKMAREQKWKKKIEFFKEKGVQISPKIAKELDLKTHLCMLRQLHNQQTKNSKKKCHHTERKDEALIDFANGWPAEQKNAIIDGDALIQRIGFLRKQSKEKSETLLQKLVFQFHKYFHLEKTILLFEKTTTFSGTCQFEDGFSVMTKDSFAKISIDADTTVFITRPHQMMKGAQQQEDLMKIGKPRKWVTWLFKAMNQDKMIDRLGKWLALFAQ